MAALIGLFIGAFAGHWLWHDWGAAIGGIAGFFIGAKIAASRAKILARATGGATASAPAVANRERIHDTVVDADPGLPSRIQALERRVESLERQVVLAHSAVAPLPTAAVDTAPVIDPASPSDIPERKHGEPPSAGILAAVGAPEPAGLPTPVPEPRASDSRVAEFSPELLQPTTPLPITPPASRGTPRVNPMWAWFTGGNALTRVGVVVLFFGVGFLLKYFTEHFTIPIELRLAAVAVGGFALLGLGARLTASRPGYGLSLQGAGAGILYLTTFAAFELYGVLPEALAVALLVAVAALTVFLAMRNDSQPLAGLAIAGGFLAPMLVVADGDPVLLFGYFAVLNAAIFALAWTKAWRALNAIGFVFTFVLGVVWGDGFYRPDLYGTVQSFLVLFFVFYVAIAILYAWRGPLAAKNPVDALLVFGVPLVGFAMQAALVRDVRYGEAWSALALSGIYALLFVALRKRNEPGLPLLSRAFLALAVIFATVAIPLALDKRTTAALWAVEAAGVYWIGVRQSARLTRAFALVIEFVAGMVFVASGVGSADDPLFANAFFSGAMLIALSGLVTARTADGAGDALTAGERRWVPLVFAWGILWWLAAGGLELARQMPRTEASHAILGWVITAVALALGLFPRFAWPRLAGAGWVLLPTMAAIAFDDFHLARTTLTAYGWMVWPCAWFVHWRVLRAADRLGIDAAEDQRALWGATKFLRAVHTASALAFTAQFSWEASEWAGRWSAPHTVWTPCAAALPAIVFLWLTLRFQGGTRWPATVHQDAYTVAAGTPIAGLLTLWFFVVNLLSPGDASPLPFVPVLNPLDLTLAVALWVVSAWAAQYAAISERARYRWIGAGLFVALNGVVLRTAHHWGDIPWRPSSLLASKPLQAALTLAWTVTALVVMYAATKRRIRPLWMLGAALLAAVIGKLFLVDLGALSGLPRVIAFVGAGLILLVIGYLSPLPPSASTSEPGGEAVPRA